MKNPGAVWAKRRLTATTEPTPADLGGGGAEGGRVQGAVAGFWRETLGPLQEICFFQNRHGPHSFHSVTSVTKAKLTPGAVVHLKFQRQLGLGPGPELTKPVTGSFSKFQVLPKVGELGTLFFDILRSLHRAGCSGPWGVSDGCGASPASPTPTVRGMQCTPC